MEDVQATVLDAVSPPAIELVAQVGRHAVASPRHAALGTAAGLLLRLVAFAALLAIGARLWTEPSHERPGHRSEPRRMSTGEVPPRRPPQHVLAQTVPP